MRFAICSITTTGELPSFNFKDYTGEGFYKSGVHGTACAEIVHDVAPEAILHLLRITDFVDLDNAIVSAIDQNIDVISMSLGWDADGMGGNKGPPAYLVNKAAANEILVVSAAGNEHSNKVYNGIWTDEDGDNWHEFSDTSEDEIAPLKGRITRGENIHVSLTWDDWNESFNSISDNDYDIYLYQI